MYGTLYLCATPIGNLEDITYRVVRVLGEVDLIAAEDTRNSLRLLNHLNIHTPMTSYHEHNKFDKARTLIEKLKEGQNIAVITDAGTPAISDPGEVLVRMCRQEGIPVTSLPGPAACITALTLTGMDSRRFCFEGFLPTEKKELEQVLKELETEKRTIILYEAPHRLKKTLDLLAKRLGEDREMTLCRELTKLHEEAYFATLGECIQKYEIEEPRGECVIVISGADREKEEEEKREGFRQMGLEEHMKLYTSQGMDKKEAMKRVAKDLGVSKREIYDRLIES